LKTVIWLFAKAPVLDWLTLAVYTGVVISLIILAIQITRIQRKLDEFQETECLHIPSGTTWGDEK
jgi:NADH:ubiquinone oxidoreductase subunit 6 (subunit J)